MLAQFDFEELRAPARAPIPRMKHLPPGVSGAEGFSLCADRCDAFGVPDALGTPKRSTLDVVGDRGALARVPPELVSVESEMLNNTLDGGQC